MEKGFVTFDENFEIESRKVEFGLKETLSINDLTEDEKEEIFSGSKEYFTMQDALEMTR